MVLGYKKLVAKLSNMQALLKISFGNVKRDTSTLFQWINYFNNYFLQWDDHFKRRAESHEHEITVLQNQVALLPKTRDEIKTFIDSYSSYDVLRGEIATVNDRINKLDRVMLAYEPIIENMIALNQQNMHLKEEIERLRSDIEKEVKKERKDSKVDFKGKLIKKIAKNTKEYVKKLVLSLIEKYGAISGLQLREMIVEEQGLCSKSSFYRILEEIENEEDIAVVIDGKEKKFFHKKTANQKI